MVEDDPLRNANVGETFEVSEDVEFSVWGYRPDVAYSGRDRESDVAPVDAEVVGSEGNEEIRVTFEGEVTKTLPARWDKCDEPRTRREKIQAKRRKWVGWSIQAISVTLPLMIAFFVFNQVQQAVSGVTIGGEPSDVPLIIEIFPVVVMVLLLAIVIYYGVFKGALPRPGPGGRYA